MTSPLWAKLQEVFSSVTHVDEKSTAPAPIEEMEVSPFHEGEVLIPSDVGTLMGPAGASLPCGLRWQSNQTETQSDLTLAWQSSQWVQLRAVWLVDAMKHCS